jgi:hypothetical protein
MSGFESLLSTNVRLVFDIMYLLFSISEGNFDIFIVINVSESNFLSKLYSYFSQQSENIL